MPGWSQDSIEAMVHSDWNLKSGKECGNQAIQTTMEEGHHLIINPLKVFKTLEMEKRSSRCCWWNIAGMKVVNVSRGVDLVHSQAKFKIIFSSNDGRMWQIN